jgi:hypothetical protein
MDESALEALLEHRAADRGATLLVEDRGAEEGWYASFRVPVPAVTDPDAKGVVLYGINGTTRHQALKRLLWLVDEDERMEQGGSVRSDRG